MALAMITLQVTRQLCKKLVQLPAIRYAAAAMVLLSSKTVGTHEPTVILKWLWQSLIGAGMPAVLPRPLMLY